MTDLEAINDVTDDRPLSFFELLKERAHELCPDYPFVREDFRTAIDAEPDNRHLLLVFADWLQEMDDGRAIGYRAIVALNKMPDPKVREKGKWGWTWAGDGMYERYGDIRRCVPECWWRMGMATTPDEISNFNRLSDAIDNAATAFSRLPPEQQRKLLNRLPITVQEGR